MDSNFVAQFFTQLRYIVRKRKWQLLLIVLLVQLPVLYYNETAQPTYEAGVSIIFEDISNPLNRDTYSQLRSFQRETYILNRIQEIQSRALSEEIANALPSDLIRRFHFPKERGPAFDQQKFLTNAISKSISATGVRRTDVVKIKFATPDPVLSMSLANTAADVLRKRNLELKRDEVSGLLEFIEQQLKIFEGRLNDSEQRLRDFKEHNKITSLQQESQEILRRMTDTEVRYNQIKAQRASTDERIQALRGQLSASRKRLIPSSTDVSNPAYSKLRQNLADLQFQYTSLLVQDYTEDHPKMVDLKQDIEQTKKRLTDEALSLLKDENVIDPLSQISSNLAESVKLEVDLETYRAQESALKRALDEYDNILKTLPEKELELASLTRSKDVNEKLYLMMMEKREEARISEAERIGNIRVIDLATLPRSPVKPRKKVNLIIGLMIGLSLSFGLAFLQEWLNRSVKTSEELEKLTSWQVLAVVPKIDIQKDENPESSWNSNNQSSEKPEFKKGVLSNPHPSGVAAEAFRVLRTNMQFLNNSKQLKTLLITSISAGDGKSTTTTNLGISLTKLGLKVLIVDADLRRPNIHKLLRVSKDPGLGDVLMNHHTIVSDLISEDLEKEFFDKNTKSPVWSSIQNLKEHNKNVEALEENFRDFSMGIQDGAESNNGPRLQYRNLLNTSLVESIQGSRTKGLKVLSCGKSLENPSEILSTFSSRILLEEVSKKFDIVLIDSPPLLLVPDSMIMSSIVDGVLVVVESNKAEHQMVLNAHKFLTKTGANVIGAVLNKADPEFMYKDKDYYYYG